MDRRQFLGGLIAALAWPAGLASASPRSGIPGLNRCLSCGEWRGRCLHPDKNAQIEVSCRCQPSLCGRCGGVVHPRRICGYYFDRERGGLVHVPWFVGMAHRCPGGDLTFHQTGHRGPRTLSDNGDSPRRFHALMGMVSGC